MYLLPSLYLSPTTEGAMKNVARSYNTYGSMTLPNLPFTHFQMLWLPFGGGGKWNEINRISFSKKICILLPTKFSHFLNNFF